MAVRGNPDIEVLFGNVASSDADLFSGTSKDKDSKKKKREKDKVAEAEPPKKKKKKPTGYKSDLLSSYNFTCKMTICIFIFMPQQDVCSIDCSEHIMFLCCLS